MIYGFQLLSHANIRYQESLSMLGQAELSCILHALGLSSKVTVETIGGSSFLCFEAPELTDDQLHALSGHSALALLCAREGALLRPLERPDGNYLPPDLAEVLKYKGKTSAVFTRMMLNMALTASDFFDAKTPVTVLDPLCGRGTTCFVALQGGMNAVGLDADRRDLKEAADYFSRYLQYHRLKHRLDQGSQTVKGRAVPDAVYTLADSKEHYRVGDTRFLRLMLGDTGLTGPLLRKSPAHVIVTDLPYGVQHAPQDGRRPEPFTAMLRRVLPSWREALRPGGAAAISFNTLTLSRKSLAELVSGAGFAVMEEEPYHPMEHFVEQAITRDVLIARKA